MNPSASLTASSLIFNAGSENFGNIVGDVTFQDGAANSGAITGNASFNGSAINRAPGLISGNATFNDSSFNEGLVSGDASFSPTATNSGTVQGTITGGGSNSQVEEVAYQSWLAANSGVNQYTGAGSHNGQWACNSTEYASQADAQAASNLTLGTRVSDAIAQRNLNLLSGPDWQSWVELNSLQSYNLANAWGGADAVNGYIVNLDLSFGYNMGQGWIGLDYVPINGEIVTGYDENGIPAIVTFLNGFY